MSEKLRFLLVSEPVTTKSHIQACIAETFLFFLYHDVIVPDNCSIMDLLILDVQKDDIHLSVLA